MKLVNTQTVKKHTRIFHIGLPARDVLVVQSMFRAQPALAECYVFGDTVMGDFVDLLFVNADDPVAVGAWQTLSKERPEVVAIMVSDGERKSARHVWVQRPLDFRNFSLLLDAITSADISRSAASALPLSPDRIKVLVVDDSFPARQFMKLKLEQIARDNSMKIVVDFADSGERAVEIVKDADYDLVFLDVEMKGMDGYETCRQLKELRRMRVTMLSGRALAADFQAGRAAGCDNYIAKPPGDMDIRTVLMLTSFKKMIHNK
ncbi:MAG: response regulator [Moraxellaceae bacterium]|nr:response regulator [Moraxellaceae bacterium]